jgi:hypothetical protein
VRLGHQLVDAIMSCEDLESRIHFLVFFLPWPLIIIIILDI